MISALHLLWIVPISATIGFVTAALLGADRDETGQYFNTEEGE